MPPTATAIPPTATATETATTIPPTATATATATTIPPTATATATAVSSSGAPVEITYIEYNPAGLDSVGEYVDLRNMGMATASMASWTLRDEVDTVYTFPAFTLAPGASVRVWIRSGTNDAENLYWGRNSATWNNNGDTAILRDASGAEVDRCSYSGGGSGVGC